MWFALLLTACVAWSVKADINSDAQSYLDDYNRNASKVFNEFVVAEWNYWTNETDHNNLLLSNASAAQSKFNVDESIMAANYDTDQLTNTSIKRQIEIIHNVKQILNDTDSKNLSTTVNNLSSFYDKGRVCNYTIYKTEGNCDNYPKNDSQAWWVSDPTITERLATSRDYDELEYLWYQWREVTGVNQRDLYKQYIQLMNKGARAAGYDDAGATWRAPYEDSTFETQIEDLWIKVLPLYEELHTYIRRKMMQKYPDKFSTSAIPAHLFGNMWAQEWNNILDFTVPYPKQPSVDVTPKMLEQKYTALKMFKTAEGFFESINLQPVPDSFWNISMIERPADGRDVECYADSEDFFNGKDFGIKMCTKITMEDLITIHHEMGHIHYFIAYSKQPIAFRDGANPGFHEAIGDTMALSAGTLTHMAKINLTDYSPPASGTDDQDINYLFAKALEKIAFLPFGFLIDHYRWKVFDGTISPDKLNAGWWSLRYQYQGIVPPDGLSKRAMNETLFDAGSKFHVAANVPYIRYFVSFVIQFQFYEALCKAANHSGPLHRCDFYKNTDAGTKLNDVLKLGYSEPWQDAMEKMTGGRIMSADAIVHYFQPLLDYLRQENNAANDCYGWGYTWPLYYNLQEPRCPAKMPQSPPTTTPSNAPSVTKSSLLIATMMLVVLQHVLAVGVN